MSHFLPYSIVPDTNFPEAPEFVGVGKAVVVVIGKDDQVNTLDPLHIVSLEQKLAHT